MSATSGSRAPTWAARRRLFIEGLGFRVALALAFSCVIAFLGVAGLFPARYAVTCVLILAALALVNVPYYVAGARAGFPTRHFFAHWGVDIAALTILIHFLGGIDTPYCALVYFGLVTFAAVNESRRVGMMLATLSLVSFGMLTCLEITGIVPPVKEVWSHHYSPTTAGFSFVAPFIFIYALAWVGGTLADKLRTANASLLDFSARIEEQNRTLEHRVTERTTELERAHREIEDLVHIVTHDLKNVSVAATETARKLVSRESAGLTPRGLKYAEHLLDDARNMSRMLENLLSLFRDAEPEAKRREWVDVEEIVRRVCGRLHYEIEAKQVQVEIGSLPAVYGEATKIQHVFDNLIDNACKYVGENRPARIVIRGQRRDGRVEYSVHDNGIGIDARHLQRVFQLYHRSPNQTVNGVEQAGHGVGLAIVKRIVERHGGTIEVESIPHRGSTFTVTFPADGEEARP
jgi:signal transduction histidine kinase